MKNKAVKVTLILVFAIATLIICAVPCFATFYMAGH